MAGIVGAFHELDATVEAIGTLKKKAFGEFTVYSPVPRHELDDAIDAPVSPVRLFALIGGLLGASFGYWIAVWSSDYWPLVVGGKAIVTWIPYTVFGFELMVLIGGLSAVFGMFANARIPNVSRAAGYDPRFSSGHFGIYVDVTPDKLKDVEEVLLKAGAVEVRVEKD